MYKTITSVCYDKIQACHKKAAITAFPQTEPHVSWHFLDAFKDSYANKIC